jgi:hypothetical protein
MSQALCRRPLTADAWVSSQAGPCEIFGGEIGTRTWSSPGASVVPLSVSFHQCAILLIIHVLLLPLGQTAETWEPSKKTCCHGNRGALDRKVFSFFLFSKGLIMSFEGV